MQNTSQADAIQQFINYLSAHSSQFLTAIAAVGIVSMAILQTIKDMLPVRNWFQEYFVGRWLAKKAAEARHASTHWMSHGGLEWFDAERARTDPAPEKNPFLQPPQIGQAQSDLIRLATDGDKDALYDLPIEQLCGQMNAAAQMMLDRPIEHSDLMRALASRADVEDVARVMFPPIEAKFPRPVQPGEPQRRYDSFIDARTRVTHQIQRAIDALQIRVGFRWKFTLQVASIVLSGLIAGIGVAMFGKGDHPIFSTIGIAILGGFLAPVARDLVAALQQLRN